MRLPGGNIKHVPAEQHQAHVNDGWIYLGPAEDPQPEPKPSKKKKHD